MVSRGLIVVDVQNDFCEGGSIPVPGGARIATKIADLVEHTAGREYQYIVATRDHHIDPGDHFSRPRTSRTAFPSTAWPEARAANSTPTSSPPSPAERST